MLPIKLEKSLLVVIFCLLALFVNGAPVPSQLQDRGYNTIQPIPKSESLNSIPYLDRALLPYFQPTFLNARENEDEFVELFRRKSIGQKIRDHFKHFGEKARSFFHKVGKVFHKIGDGIKTVGLKIAKYAAKAVAVVGTYVGKVVGLVCKPAGKAIELGSGGMGKLANKLNDLDHHQSAKERKVFHGLDIAEHPMSYAAKAIEDKAKGKGKAATGAAKAGGAILKALF